MFTLRQLKRDWLTLSILIFSHHFCTRLLPVQEGQAALRFPTRLQSRVSAMATEAPVGDWVSPVTSELITSKSIGLGAAKAGPDGLVYWLEGRPTEGGRQVLVRRYEFAVRYPPNWLGQVPALFGSSVSKATSGEVRPSVRRR